MPRDELWNDLLWHGVSLDDAEGLPSSGHGVWGTHPRKVGGRAILRQDVDGELA